MSNYYRPIFRDDAERICEEYDLNLVNVTKEKEFLKITAESYELKGGKIRYHIIAHKPHRQPTYYCKVVESEIVITKEREVEPAFRKEKEITIC